MSEDWSTHATIEMPDLDEITDLATAKLLLAYLRSSTDQQARTTEQLLKTVESLRQEIAKLRSLAERSVKLKKAKSPGVLTET